MNKNEKSIIERLLRIEQILRLRREEHSRLNEYNAGEVRHEKQLEFHRCAKRNRWILGGNRSGKTEAGAVESLWMALGRHPFRKNKKNITGWVVSVSYEVQREVAQNKILHYLSPSCIEDITMKSGSKGSPRSGIIDTIAVRNIFGGVSRIVFKSADQGREKFQGASVDFVWFDEEPPQDIYQECRMRIMDTKGDIFGTMTPLKGLTFVYEEIFLNKRLDPEIQCFHMEWADNPFLDKAEIELMTKSMSEEMLQSRRYGKFMLDTGLVYSEFDENIHVIEPFDAPKEWYDTVSIDPGLNNPLSAHFYCVDYDGNIYVIAEHYEKGKDIDYHANAILNIAKRLDWHFHNGKLQALIDSSASQRTLAASKSAVELFYEKGIAANPNVRKDIFAGIARVKEYFAARPPRIFIFKNCVNLIRELKSYWWSRGDIPKRKDDHALDELRYYIMSRPKNDRRETKRKSLQELYKERLMARSKYRNMDKDFIY
ncbi:MAG TPA: hypothetical protein GXZ92_01250 [Clostridiales bacterium]|jgi:phage terminase large subunit-like protein|nr:hypothetical protein [Clostridiales bacterium]